MVPWGKEHGVIIVAVVLKDKECLENIFLHEELYTLKTNLLQKLQFVIYKQQG